MPLLSKQSKDLCYLTLIEKYPLRIEQRVCRFQETIGYNLQIPRKDTYISVNGSYIIHYVGNVNVNVHNS